MKPPKAAGKPGKHPHHADAFALWTEAHQAATGESYRYTGACAKRLTVVLDEFVPREGDATKALADLGNAIRAFHRKPVDAFPAGWTVLGFAQDVNRWVQAARSTAPARQARPEASPDAERAWAHASGLAMGHIPGQPIAPPADAVEARARKVFSGLDGWVRIKGNEYARKQLQTDFLAAWVRLSEAA